MFFQNSFLVTLISQLGNKGGQETPVVKNRHIGGKNQKGEIVMKMTKKQSAMPVDFMKMNVGDLQKAYELLVRMVEEAQKEGGILAKPHDNVTIPLSFLARALEIDYEGSIELKKIKVALEEIGVVINALVNFAKLMYPSSVEKVIQEKVRQLHFGNDLKEAK